MHSMGPQDLDNAQPFLSSYLELRANHFLANALPSNALESAIFPDIDLIGRISHRR